MNEFGYCGANATEVLLKITLPAFSQVSPLLVE
jgi:hypothetical protein